MGPLRKRSQAEARNRSGWQTAGGRHRGQLRDATLKQASEDPRATVRRNYFLFVRPVLQAVEQGPRPSNLASLVVSRSDQSRSGKARSQMGHRANPTTTLRSKRWSLASEKPRPAPSEAGHPIPKDQGPARDKLLKCPQASLRKPAFEASLGPTTRAGPRPAPKQAGVSRKRDAASQLPRQAFGDPHLRASHLGSPLKRSRFIPSREARDRLPSPRPSKLGRDSNRSLA